MVPRVQRGTCLLTPFSVFHIRASQAPAPSARASLSQSLVATWLTGERSRSGVGLCCHGLAPAPSLCVLETRAKAPPVLHVWTWWQRCACLRLGQSPRVQDPQSREGPPNKGTVRSHRSESRAPPRPGAGENALQLEEILGRAGE